MLYECWNLWTLDIAARTRDPLWVGENADEKQALIGFSVISLTHSLQKKWYQIVQQMVDAGK